MKIDISLDVWYAWKEGDYQKLLSIFENLIKDSEQDIHARIPSVTWAYYSLNDRHSIVLTIMLSNRWTLYSDRSRMTFDRNRGPPIKEPYVNFFYSKCFINVEE